MHNGDIPNEATHMNAYFTDFNTAHTACLSNIAEFNEAVDTMTAKQLTLVARDQLNMTGYSKLRKADLLAAVKAEYSAQQHMAMEESVEAYESEQAPMDTELSERMEAVEAANDAFNMTAEECQELAELVYEAVTGDLTEEEWAEEQAAHERDLEIEELLSPVAHLERCYNTTYIAPANRATVKALAASNEPQTFEELELDEPQTFEELVLIS